MTVETAVARCTSRCALARGHRLNASIVLAAVHGLSGLFRAVSAVEPSLSRPLKEGLHGPILPSSAAASILVGPFVEFHNLCGLARSKNT